MAPGSASNSYDGAQRAFHWIMAALILLAILLGVIASLLPAGPSPRGELLLVHKSLGMTALILGILRIGYRLTAGAPPYREALGPLTGAAAHATHFALYGLMIAMPVTGYINSVAGGHEAPWFGLFDFPVVVPHDKALAHWGAQAHYWLAWAIGAFLTIHLLGVVWHAWIKRDQIFARMWPGQAALAGRGERA